MRRAFKSAAHIFQCMREPFNTSLSGKVSLFSAFVLPPRRPHFYCLPQLESFVPERFFPGLSTFSRNALSISPFPPRESSNVDITKPSTLHQFFRQPLDGLKQTIIIFFEICSARSGASSTAGNWAAVFKPAGESGSSVGGAG